jgi:uncharacterized protein (TIGR03435 family)
MKSSISSTLWAFIVTMFLASVLPGSQSAAQSSNKLAFEVASIKPAVRMQLPPGTFVPQGRCRGIDSKFPPNDVGNSTPFGRCVIRSRPLESAIGLAYNLPVQRVAIGPNGPSWAKSNSVLFDIEANVSDPATTTEQQLLIMLQNLLADRFKLKVHSGTRTMDGFALVVAKGGPKLTRANIDGDEGISPGPASRTHFEISCRKVSMSRLALFLSTGRPIGPIVDRTNLRGVFDFTLTADEDVGPSVFTALEEQLGLKLERQSVPVEFVVIDSAERPTQD